MKNNPNIDMLELVASGLRDFCNEVVFVGGSVTAFYIKDLAATDIRPTNDVDCVVELASVTDYHALETKVRSLGFNNQVRAGRSLICRWEYQGVVVDIMTTDAEITGFTNRWYAEGIRNKVIGKLPSGRKIYLFSPPYFIATKFEAFKSRGGNDYRTSHDIEDIVTVLDGGDQADLNARIPENLKKYLQQEFSTLLASGDVSEILHGHLSRTGSADERVKRLMEVMRSIF